MVCAAVSSAEFERLVASYEQSRWYGALRDDVTLAPVVRSACPSPGPATGVELGPLPLSELGALRWGLFYELDDEGESEAEDDFDEDDFDDDFDDDFEEDWEDDLPEDEEFPDTFGGSDDEDDDKGGSSPFSDDPDFDD